MRLLKMEIQRQWVLAYYLAVDIMGDKMLKTTYDSTPHLQCKAHEERLFIYLPK